MQHSPFEIGEIGPELFRGVCDMGLEGIVSEHRDLPDRADAGACTTRGPPT